MLYIADPINKDEDAEVAPLTVVAAESEVVTPEEQEHVDTTTELANDEIGATIESEQAQILSDEPIEEKLSEDLIVKKSTDEESVDTETDVDLPEQTSVEDIVTTEISVPLADDDVSTIEEKLESITAVVAEEESEQELRDDSTTVAEVEAEESVTESSSSYLLKDDTEAITETEEPIESYFRSEDPEDQEVTTEITAEERAETATDTYFEDATSRYADEDATTDIPEETDLARSELKGIQGDVDGISEVVDDSSTDAPISSIIKDVLKDDSETSDDEVIASTDFPIQKSDDQEENTTEVLPQEIKVKSTDQIFADAAPISVVEIKQDESLGEEIIHENSAPIEIVEITELPEVEERADETQVDDETTTEPTFEEAIAKKEEIKEELDEEETVEITETEETKPLKAQPSEIDNEYWLKMQEASKKSQSQSSSSSTVVSDESTKVETLADDSDSDIETEISESEAVESTQGSDSSVSELTEKSSVDDEIEKVTQKYGLTPVDKSKVKTPAQEIDDPILSNDVDMLKEDLIYSEKESKNEFQDSNDLQRRLSFGDKVVRFVRSHW